MGNIDQVKGSWGGGRMRVVEGSGEKNGGRGERRRGWGGHEGGVGLFFFKIFFYLRGMICDRVTW